MIKSQGTGGIKRKRAASGGSRPSTMTRMIIGQDDAASSKQQELEQQLLPTADECSKLASVIRMLDKHGVGNEKLPAEAGVPTLLDALNPSIPGWPHTLHLLEFYLDLASSAPKTRTNSASSTNGSFNNTGDAGQSVSTYASASTSALLNASPSTGDTDIDHLSNTIRGVLEELKDAAAARLGQKWIKPAGQAKYALHRSIGGSYDVFSSVTEIVPNDDKTWQQLGDTDLLAVYPTELATLSSAPRLGDVNGPQPMATKRAIELQPEIEPVSFLYYDPYQSFAPTYDSSTATLSYAQSVSLRESRQIIQAWDKRPLPPLPPQDLASTIRPLLNDSIGAIDPALFSSSNEVEKIQPEEMKLYLRMMEESQIIDKRLQENTQLLRALQEAQWHRLRKSESTASDLERKSAERLLESLTSLANARPRTPDVSEDSSPFTSNPAIAASIVQNKSKAYYGILDQANYKGIPDYVMIKNEDNDKKEGSTLVSPEMGRKSSTQGQKKSKKNSNSAKKEKSLAQDGSNGSPAVQVSELPASVAALSQIKQETPAV